MANRSVKSEQVKKIALGALGAVFLGVMVYQFVLSPSSTTDETPNANRASAQPAKKQASGPPAMRPPSSNEERNAWVQQQLADLTPLNLSRISHESVTVEPDKKEPEDPYAYKGRGNIFAYYVAPPPRPAPLPPPPPIVIQAAQVNRNIVAGSPFKVTVMVLGQKFPADAEIYFDGRPKPTKRVSESQLTTEMEPGEYSFPRTIKVEVKSKSDPKLFSNETQISIPQAPEPNFIYRGRHGTTLANIEIPSSRPEFKLLKRGDIVQGVWRIDSINEREIEVTHTQLEIRRRIPMQQARPQ
ncbi:MAG TPA: IPT/TIG domain-containing protein [Blastocatellia bacterium]|nr:IPT/TIG domain-containing protein [Blastocatellia bacterium]